MTSTRQASEPRRRVTALDEDVPREPRRSSRDRVVAKVSRVGHAATWPHAAERDSLRRQRGRTRERGGNGSAHAGDSPSRKLPHTLKCQHTSAAEPAQKPALVRPTLLGKPMPWRQSTHRSLLVAEGGALAWRLSYRQWRGIAGSSEIGTKRLRRHECFRILPQIRPG
jgi:hypothetical protein